MMPEPYTPKFICSRFPVALLNPNGLSLSIEAFLRSKFLLRILRQKKVRNAVCGTAK